MKRLLFLVALVEVLAISATALATPGATIWTKRYNGSGNSYDRADSIAVSPDGTKVFVTGSSAGSGGADDYATVAYSATGSKLWVARFKGSGNGAEATSLKVSPDGTRVFVTGSSAGSGSNDDYSTVAYDASTGARLWAARYNGPGNSIDMASSLGVSPDGTEAFVTGGSFGVTSGSDYATVAYDTTTGARLWVRRYTSPGNGDDSATSLGVSPDGTKVFVTGASNGSGCCDYATVAYRASTGHTLWVARYNGPGNGADIARSLGVSPDGTMLFVTGSSAGPGSALDYATVAYNPSTGAKVWVRRYNGPGNGMDEGYSLGVSPDGTEVFVTGFSDGSGSGFVGMDYATVAYDASTGSRQWVSRYNGPGNGDDRATSLGVSPDGTEVFVTGGSSKSNGLCFIEPSCDYATVAYDASTGAKLWAARYNGPGNDFDDARALAVSPGGTEVFVTGGSTGNGTDSDYTTIAYRTS